MINWTALGRLGTTSDESRGATWVLREGSVGNAIRFDRNGTMFIADYKSTTSSRPGGLHLAAAGIKTLRHIKTMRPTEFSNESRPY